MANAPNDQAIAQELERQIAELEGISTSAAYRRKSSACASSSER